MKNQKNYLDMTIIRFFTVANESKLGKFIFLSQFVELNS